jgi:hypothetical protein
VAVNIGRTSRFQLHSGKPRVRKQVAAGVLVFCIFMLTPLVAAYFPLALGSVGQVSLGVVVGVVIGLWWEWIWVSSLLRILRSAAWLDDITLVVRGPYATRRCCLATADQLAIRAPRAWRADPALSGARPARMLRVPQLSASDPATGRTIRLDLVDPATRALLAPAKLTALANAIAAPSPRGRSSTSAWQVAGMLRELAAESDTLRY